MTWAIVQILVFHAALWTLLALLTVLEPPHARPGDTADSRGPRLVPDPPRDQQDTNPPDIAKDSGSQTHRAA